MIDSKDISVVVQGAIHPVLTKICLNSIRKALPDSEIILSTWKHSYINNLEFDILLENDDPGTFKLNATETCNVKRQILSTIEGINLTKNKYILKIRSDIQLLNSNFLNYFELFDKYDEKYHFLQKRIIVASQYTRDPKFFECAMCPSDWISFGLKDDMKTVWGGCNPSYDEENWFMNHRRSDNVYKYDCSLISKYNPEQYIWINFLKKFIPDIYTKDMFDINPDNIELTRKTFANNLIILPDEKIKIKFLKKNRKYCDRYHVITYCHFLKLYNHYCNDNKPVPKFDFYKYKLFFKHFKYAHKRIWSIAIKNDLKQEYIEKELKFVTNNII